MDIHIALSQLNKETGCEYSLNGESLDGLIWLSKDIEKPTQKDLDDAFKRWETDYIKLRSKEYPSIEDQLDKIYHEGIEAWKSDIKKIKDKYPKS